MTGGHGSNKTTVSVRDVCKSFGATPALDKVTFRVEEGEFVALVGRSGAGKSTLLRCLNGLQRPSSGVVEVLAVELTAARRADLRAIRRQVGFIFQQFNLVGRVSCLENVCMGALGRMRGPRLGLSTYPRSVRREALEHLERVELGPQVFQRADTLSGGQQQRVAIARSLMQSPKLLLADEPVASLDPESSVQVLDVLLRICREEGLTVICSLHQVELAMGWAQRVIGLRCGRVVLDAPATGMAESDLRAVYRSDVPRQQG
jgi:phosphonate transport system ATP-binding protein